MSVFGKSFDDKVRKQLNLRENILSGDNSTAGILNGRSEQYLQYANNKTPFIRLSSGVNVTDPLLKKYFNISSNDELATRFILEGGTLLSNKSNDSILSQQRSTFTGNSGIYGAGDLGGTSDFGLRPMPGIGNISVKSYGENISTLRIATVSLTCYTIQQLEALEVLYMRPGFRVLLEWGHNLYFNDINNPQPTQVNQNVDIIAKYNTKEDIIKTINKFKTDTSYNYDAMFGKVRNFSWEAQTDGSYRCTVEIISLGDIIDSLKINVTPLVDVDKETSVSDNDSLSASNIFTTILDFIKHRAILVPETPQSVSSNNSAIAVDIDGNPLPVNTSPKVGYKTGFVLVSDNEGILPGGLKNSKIKSFTLGGTEKGEYAYISLETLCTIINKACIYLEGGKPVISIDTKNGLGNCLSHPYQISSNPRLCLINPGSNSGDINFYGWSPQDRKDYSDNFPYRDGINDDFKGSIKNIAVNIEACKDLFNSLITEEDNKHKVIIKDFLQKLMDDIAYYTGDINKFIVAISPLDENKIDIIDFNYVDAPVKALRSQLYQTIPLMGVGNLSGTNNEDQGGTYVRTYRLNTQLTNDIATTVSIAAQADKTRSVDGYNTSVFNAFNQGIKDRLAEEIDNVAVNQSSFKKEEEQRKMDLLELGNNVLDSLKKINIPYNTPLSTNEVDALAANINDLINYVVTYDESSSITFGSYTPIPLNLELTMDGISGLKVGQIFLIPKDRLSFQYKIFDPRIYPKNLIGEQRVAFIIFGIDHSVDGNGGWTTSLNCKMVMLNPNIPPFLFQPGTFKVDNTKRSADVVEEKELPPRFKYIEDEIFNGIETPRLILENEDGIDVEYLFSSQNKPKFLKHQTLILNEFKNEGIWSGFKLKFIPIEEEETTKNYLFLGRYVTPNFGAPYVAVYFPFTTAGITSIDKFTRNELEGTNANLYEFYSSELTSEAGKNYKDGKAFENKNVKSLWYGNGNQLLTYDIDKDPKIIEQRRIQASANKQSKVKRPNSIKAGF